MDIIIAQILIVWVEVLINLYWMKIKNYQTI